MDQRSRDHKPALSILSPTTSSTGVRIRKAKSLGELAMHIAVLHGNVAELAVEDVHEFAGIPSTILKQKPSTDPGSLCRKSGKGKRDRSLDRRRKCCQRASIGRKRKDPFCCPADRLLADGAAKPLLSSPRPTHDISANSRYSAAVGLWTERGHESFRLSEEF